VTLAPENILEEFKDKQSRYKLFTKSVENLCLQILGAIGIDHLSIESRTKTYESIKGKILRPEKAGKYENLTDITDISGVRIILYLQEDCDNFLKALKDHFIIDERNSIDKIKSQQEDRFGYLSVHVVVSHTDIRTKLVEFRDYSGMKCELQIRTVLQHAWSAIDWKLRYKTENEIPSELKRKLYRISALLELADDEFSSISEKSSNIKKSYDKQISTSKYNIEINKESITAYIDKDSVFNSIANSVIGSTNMKYNTNKGDTSTRASYVISTAKQMGLSKISDINQIISNEPELIIESVKRVLNTSRNLSKSPVTFTTKEAILRIAMIIGMHLQGKDVSKAMASIFLLPHTKLAIEKELGLK